MIEAHRLGVRMGSQWVLQDVSLQLRRGEILGIIGPPQAGKSILLKTIAGLLQPQSGALRLDGAPLRASSTEWRQRVGMAFQNDALFDALTVFDNVAFPLRRRKMNEQEVRTRVEQRLTDVELEDVPGKFPREISGGMRKRAGIARATVINPEIALFDDPIAGLDPLTSQTVLSLVVNLTESLGSATAIVSNDLPVLVPICHRVLVLHAGEVVFFGTAEGLEAAEHPVVWQFVRGMDAGPL